jgi:signal transduction histidine kinase
MTRTRKITNNILDHHTELAEKLQMLEQHLDQLEDQLIRAQRLAALGTMATMIAHEFNNILTPVVSYAQYALKQGDTDLMKKALEKAYHNGYEAAEVCRQLLNFGRGESSTRTCVVSEIVAASLKCLVRNPAKDNIELTVEVAENLTVPIEPCLLQQVIYNLIINARDAMLGRPGRLKISAATSDDGQVQIQVSDSGTGIDPAILPKIFAPFFTTKNTKDSDRKGSGLGLAVSKHIIERADGKIAVQSEPGHGTTFTLTLPKI